VTRESVKPAEALKSADTWHDEIVRAFAAQKQLAEDQKARLAELRDEVKLRTLAAARGEIDPDAIVRFDSAYIHEVTLKVPPPPEAERFTALAYLQQSTGPARSLFRGMVSDIDGLERLTPEKAQALLARRSEEVLEHYRDAGLPITSEQKGRLAQARDSIAASISKILRDDAFQSRLNDYRLLLARAGEDAGSVHAHYTRERLDADRKNLDLIAGEMLALVNEAVSEFDFQAQTIATVAQLGAGPPPRPGEDRLWVDSAIKLSLIGIGLLLMLGLFTPVAGLAAAGQLAMFYLASPPWPGFPAASLGGHFLFVDRNLIELIAALVIAATASGRWAGLDAYLSFGRKDKEQS
jgi:uncharacterized membrane protein YphA (DoxX/SURF4 family)